MRYGIQLYGVRNLYQQNRNLFYEKMKSAGVSFVEPCVVLNSLREAIHVVWSMEEYKENISLLKKYDMDMVSVHIFSANLPADTEELIALVKEFPIKYIVLKSPEILTKEKLLETAYVYMNIADMLEPYGVKVCIHNDAEEIRTRIERKTAYEWLIDACQNKVFMQVDIGWLQTAGEALSSFLWKNKQHILSIHYKDFGDSSEEVSIGKGQTDILDAFQFARANGLEQIIDQDHFTKEIEEEVKDAVQYLDSFAQNREHTVSFLNILDVETGKVEVVHSFQRIIEAPNWLKENNCLMYNSEGSIYRYDLIDHKETKIDTGICNNCNNDHVISPDEKFIAVSHGPADSKDFESRVYIIPIEGGEAKLVTPNSPSFLHGWSPDGKALAYCAFRIWEGKMEIDIYEVDVNGGEEIRLTDGGFNDGPEYSPDGKYIWFNSTRSGLMQIWRLNREDNTVRQMTDNNRNNWFGHVSPDGDKVVYLSYKKGELQPHEHLPNMKVELWIMDQDGKNQRKLISLFGGQGSINVNSWAKDNKHIAFVSYELLKGDKKDE